jgi:hypothetical protein
MSQTVQPDFSDSVVATPVCPVHSLVVGRALGFLVRELIGVCARVGAFLFFCVVVSWLTEFCAQTHNHDNGRHAPQTGRIYRERISSFAPGYVFLRPPIIEYSSLSARAAARTSRF